MKVSRVLIGIAVVLATAAGAIFVLRPQPSSPIARNVIFISIDTLRADHLSCYGYDRPTSPQIDAFARRGARFEHVTSSSGWTVPAHMTMFTGLDPLGHGVDGYPHPGKQRPKGQTLAQILSRNGFATAAFVGGGYMLARFGFYIGFDKFESKGRQFALNAGNARAFLRKNRNKRFFLFFHGYDVHQPYRPTPSNDRMFARDYHGGFKISQLGPENPRPSAPDLQFAIAQYDAKIRDVDDVLGPLLAEWEQAGLLDDTLVVITSDHGDEFYEHGQIYHAHSLYDELLRVPLIMVGPGIKPGVYSTQVGLIDLMPTILSALGFAGQTGAVQGMDLMPVMRGDGELPKRLIFSSLRFSEWPYSIKSVRSDEWKLIAWDVAGMRDHTFGPDRDEHTYKMRLDRREKFDELFDLRTDPGETKDVGAEQAATHARLGSVLESRLAAGNAVTESGEKPQLSPKEIEDLKALGYL